MNRGERYDKMTQNPQSDELKFFERYNENMEFVQTLVRECQPARVFDIGCGTGNLTGVLSSDFTVIGIDSSDEMLSQLSSKYPKVETINRDVDNWIADQSFKENDMITSSFVLHAIEDKSPIFDGFISALSSGAHIILLDYVFKTAKDESDFIDGLRENGKAELVELVERKHYMKLDEIRDWCSLHNLIMKTTMLTHWICTLQINQKQQTAL